MVIFDNPALHLDVKHLETDQIQTVWKRDQGDLFKSKIKESKANAQWQGFKCDETV